MTKKEPHSQEKSKSAVVPVRFTPAERDGLKEEAKAVNLSLSEYIRRTTLERPLPRPRTEISVDTYRELGRIGNNVNQLAAAANLAVKMGHSPAVTPQQWSELRRLIDRVRLEWIG